MPKWGSVPMRTYDNVPVRQTRDSVAAPRVPTQGPVVSPRADAAPDTGGVRWTGRYYQTDQQSLLHTWDFVDDGTYLYREVYNGGGVSHGTSERGTYILTGNTLEVHVRRITDASGSTVSGRTTMAAGETAPGRTRRYTFAFLGPLGRDGIVMNGVLLKPKSW